MPDSAAGEGELIFAADGFDVDQDGHVRVQDAAAVIDELARGGQRLEF